MAQGKLKVKSKGGSKPPAKKKHEKKPQGLKKGKLAIAPKKQVTCSVYFTMFYNICIRNFIISASPRSPQIQEEYPEADQLQHREGGERESQEL